MRIFGLDRICDLAIIDDRFLDDPLFNAEQYFQNTIGISLHDNKVEGVILSFSPHEGNYVKTQHLHSSQAILVDDGTELRVRLNVVINYELVSTVLSFGDGVKVIAPDNLKIQVIKHLSGCMAFYNS